MDQTPRATLLALCLASGVTAVLGLVPDLYHRWWWWDILVHALAAGLLAAWTVLGGVPRRWRWPAFLSAALAWEWLELWVRWFLSPGRGDVLLDLSVNVVVFWAALTVLEWIGAVADDGGSHDVGRRRVDP